ncbi:hypothetical protein BO70DRAFT_384138 [Aspergillus heteromorphus CBS 117.55]|uniref:WD40 repeat-like protein n=1 Tax=Aspergillus heteromorphus CBS 117.55 TaxID=1448321 RepID=A0A317X237_9EURO|nr:uncharacterized protein BO70DRAFT_384138 [Aspergillus heteromorphus CBS 117.55]PWY92669.1 hypothetical protein BO70DRAFT_384138 [Aspergillus heteromorphus CBS 117.55]
MSHPLVAAVWEQLGRRDLANILREIIGGHALDIALFQQDAQASVEPLTRAVFWIKTIFDAQRTYLQGVGSARDCHPYFSPYLLPSETVFSALMYLLKVKVELFPCSKSTDGDLIRYRLLIAHTVLAGIRVLLLRGEPISTDQKFKLERALRAAWRNPDLSNVERFLISDLLPKAIARIGSSDLSTSQAFLLDCAKPYIPPFATGLYPISGAPETLITDLLTGVMKNDADQLLSFCLLFDILWAVDSALVQCHIDRRRISQEQGYTSAAAYQVDEAFHQAQDVKKKLTRTVLAAFDDEFNTAPLRVFATTILSQTAEEHPPLQTRRIRDTWSQLLPIRESWERASGQFVRWLINRRVQMWDCNGELEAFSHDYQQHLTQWLQSSAAAEVDRNQSRTGRSTAVYVVNCPAVHPVPGTLLEERLKTHDKRAYEQLQGSPEFLTMDIACPLCTGNVRIQHARMIEPLEQLSDALHYLSDSDTEGHYSLPDSTSRDTTSCSSSLSHSTSHSSRFEPAELLKSPVSSPPPTAVSKISTKQPTTTTTEIFAPVLSRSRTDQSLDKQSIKAISRDLKNVKLPFSGGASLFRRSSARGHQLPRQPRFCFSTSGSCLLFWGAGSNWVMRFDVSSGDNKKAKGHKYDIPGVQQAAAGDQRCAVIASAGQHYELLVFENDSDVPEAYLTIETENQSFPVSCMAMSRNDRYVAFTLKDQVRVYEICTRTIQRVSLGSGLDGPSDLGDRSMMGGSSSKGTEYDGKRQEAVIERKLQFSADGKQFVIATHLGDHYAYVDVWNCTFQQWNIVPERSKSFKLPPWTNNDGDLTGVFYDSTHEAVLLAAFFAKEYPSFFSMADDKTVSDSFSPRIVHAAQSPSGSRFVMANGTGDIYLCDDKVNGRLKPTKVKKASYKIHPSVFRPGQLALSFPQETETLAFWVKAGKLMLRTVRMLGGTEAVSDYDLRSDFDRLVVERPMAADFHTQRRRHSVLSHGLVAEIDGLPSIPRPDLPELSSI